IDIPAGLVKDSGILIDVLFVFSVDADEYIRGIGSTPYDQAILAVTQANLAMHNSEDDTPDGTQGVLAFNGADDDNPLNDMCGYGTYPEPGTVTNPPAVPPPALPQPPRSCVGTDSLAYHEARAGVTPAESDVCLPRLRLVGALVCDGFFGQEEPYDSTGYAIDLQRLEDPDDGYIDYVHDWRNALGADAVALVGMGYNAQSGFSGVAERMFDTTNDAQFGAGLNIPGNPHPIVDVTNPLVVPVGGIMPPSDVSTLRAFSEKPFCLVEAPELSGLTYAHELGHNLGCQHDHNNAGLPAGAALFADSFGFGDDDYRTVMAYPAGGNVPLAGFSNPNKIWDDYIPGDPTDATGEAGKAFDFDCTLLDGDGTDLEYIEGSGVVAAGEDPCTNTSDDDPNDPAAM
ncbi:MAG: hypothetical protein FJ247_14345, partial [Nitrospira sp.]|nr:hypothetical protein [Nitrospira sp.]